LAGEGHRRLASERALSTISCLNSRLIPYNVFHGSQSSLRWHLIRECHTGHAPMAESSQSRALSREGSSSKTRNSKPANSCPQELGYKPALPGPARRGFGSLFLCQSSIVKIIAFVLKQKTFLCVWLVSTSVATRSLYWPKQALVGLQARGVDRWMGCTKQSRYQPACVMYRLFQARKEKPSNIWELQLSSRVVRLGNLTWTRKSLLPQSVHSPRNAWKRGRCCPLHVLVRPGPDVAFLCFVGLFIMAKWLTLFRAKWLIYAYMFTVHLIYQSTRLLEQTLLLIHTMFVSFL
jgi:hypothetical protein